MKNSFLWVFVVTILTLRLKFTHEIFGIPDFLELGSCADTKVMTQFDPIKYQGLWFDVLHVPNEYQQAATCISQNYTWIDSRFDITLTGVSEDGNSVVQLASMHEEYDYEDSFSDSNPAKMIMDAADVPEAPYEVLWTDYDSVSCVYSCLSYPGFKAAFSWILGRTPNLPKSKIDKCLDVFHNFGIDPNRMMRVKQEEGCPYFTKIEEILDETDDLILEITDISNATLHYRNHRMGELQTGLDNADNKIPTLQESKDISMIIDTETHNGIVSNQNALVNMRKNHSNCTHPSSPIEDTYTHPNFSNTGSLSVIPVLLLQLAVIISLL